LVTELGFSCYAPSVAPLIHSQADALLASREEVGKSRFLQDRNLAHARIDNQLEIEQREIARRRQIDEVEVKARELTEREQITLTLSLERARIESEREQRELELERRRALG
jgi:hypothetical protein